MTGEPTIVVDGSYGEGGGALLRTALVMSALTQRPVRLNSVRGAMRKPGLAAEDLAFIQVLAQSSGASLSTTTIGSREIEFAPKHALKPISMLVDIGSHNAGKTPGNSLIVAQSLLAALARSGAFSQLDIIGETHNNGTLCFDAFERSTLAAHRRQGLYTYSNLVKTGFGYGTQGQVTIQIEPSALNNVVWSSRGSPLSFRAALTVTGVPEKAVETASSRCKELLAEKEIDCPVEIIELSGNEPGLSLTFWAEYENGMGSASGCLSRGGRPNPFVESVFTRFSDWLNSDATVDSHLADQILVPAVFAEGKSVYTTPIITRRLTTMARIIKQFMPVHITIKGREGTPGTVSVEK